MLQLTLVRFAAFENHFCSDEKQCAWTYRRRLSAHDVFEFSNEVDWGGLHNRTIELQVRTSKITRLCYERVPVLQAL